MNILHDKSSVKSSSAKWIDRGYAREDVHSLRLQYVYTPEQQEANRQIAMPALMRRIVGSGRLPSQKML